MSGVRRVGCDPTCTPLGPRDVLVLDGWKPAASHLLCGAHDALQPQSVSGGGSSYHTVMEVERMDSMMAV